MNENALKGQIKERKSVGRMTDIRCQKTRQVAYEKFRCILARDHAGWHEFHVRMTLRSPPDRVLKVLTESYAFDFRTERHPV